MICKEEECCRKVGDRRLRSGEENRCSPDTFAVWAFAALGRGRCTKDVIVGTLC